MPYDVKKSHYRFERICRPKAVVVEHDQKKKMMFGHSQIVVVVAVPL